MVHATDRVSREVNVRNIDRAVCSANSREINSNVTEEQCEEIAEGGRPVSRDEAWVGQLETERFACESSQKITRQIHQEEDIITFNEPSRDGERSAKPESASTTSVRCYAEQDQQTFGDVDTILTLSVSSLRSRSHDV